MVDRNAKFATEHLAGAVNRIDSGLLGNVMPLSRFSHANEETA